MLCNNADARRCSYFELGLPVVCRVFSLFENVPVTRQSRADTRNFSKGKNSVDFTLFAMCALSHNAPCSLQKKQIAKTLAGIVFNFPETTNEKLQVMQYFGRQTRCIMRDVQLPSSKAILGFLNWSLCYGYSWKFCKIFWLWVFSLFKTLPGCRAYNHGVF